MMLRDWFAGQAMPEGVSYLMRQESGGYAEAAAIAYEFADAMLVARGFSETADAATSSEVSGLVDQLETSGKAPWLGKQRIEDFARKWKGRQWVPLDAAVSALQFWQRRDFEHGETLARLEASPTAPEKGEVNAGDKAVAAMRAYVTSAGVPATEFDVEFVTKMMAAMMVSFHKYGRVADAYPLKFDAASDVRARMAKYRQTGNKHYLVDAANFAMIEAMHPSREATWGSNDAADSPGRTTAGGHRLVQEDNAGNRIFVEAVSDQ